MHDEEVKEVRVEKRNGRNPQQLSCYSGLGCSVESDDTVFNHWVSVLVA